MSILPLISLFIINCWLLQGVPIEANSPKLVGSTDSKSRYFDFAKLAEVCHGYNVKISKQSFGFCFFLKSSKQVHVVHYYTLLYSTVVVENMYCVTYISG